MKEPIKSLIKQLENAACDCDMANGYACPNHKIANQLRDEIEKESEISNFWKVFQNKKWNL